ncbi:MAG: NAD-dependent epimerase/dehydratase family protein [Thermoplasmata archaeon]
MGHGVLVTGGGGFVGKAVVEKLIKRKEKVFSFSRGIYPELEKMGVTTLRGDLTKYEDIYNALESVDTVFHIAAKPGFWGPYSEYFRANALGTWNLLVACRKRGVERFIFCSSASVVFGDKDLEGVDESVPYPAEPRSFYTATKALAERAVLYANSKEMKTISLRPHLIWGPGDNHLVPRIIERAREGKIFQVGDGKNKVDTTYIDNCADALLNAADALLDNPDAAGRPYFISNGEPVNTWEMIRKILEAADAPQPKFAVPRSIAMASAGMLEFVHSTFRLSGEPRITRFLVEELSTSHWFDISAAKKELKYSPKVSIEEGLKRLKVYYKNG